MSNQPKIGIEHKIVVGSNDVSYIPSDATPTGTSVLNGPVWVGKISTAPAYQGVLNVGPVAGQLKSGTKPPLITDTTMYMEGLFRHIGNTIRIGDVHHTGKNTQIGDYDHTGDVHHIGDSLHIGCFVIISPPTCILEWEGNLKLKGWIHTTEEITTDTYLQSGSFANIGTYLDVGTNGDFGGNVTTGGNVTASGNVTSNGGAHVLSAKKNFDIPHPTKEGHRLRYVCTESPEAGVYVRGKSKENFIELPEYWSELVHTDSITVNLTPFGAFQQLFVKEIKDNKVYVGGGLVVNGEELFSYHYTVFAERKDCEQNIAEYEGQTPADYPGDNDQCSVSGYHYDVKG